MREITRTLTTRIPILAISVTCGCALNFGQVNASGTVNATADVDTTVNASGSATVVQNPSEGQQQTASPAPSATPTEAPAPGPGTLYVHHVPKMSGPDSSLGLFSYAQSFDGPVAYVYYEASKERNLAITYTKLSQEGTLPAEPVAFVDLTYSSDGGSHRADSTKNGAVEFLKENGFMVIPAGKTYMAVLGVKRSWAYPYYKGVDDYDYNLFNTFFLGKKVRFTILKPTDIRTLSGAKIEGNFPLQGPLISF